MTAVLAAVDYSQGIEDAWSRVAAFVPKFIAFVVILVIGWFVAKAVTKALDKVLERVGFDRAVERGGVHKALAQSKYDASTIVAKIAFYALFLLVLQLAFGIFGPNPVSDLIAGIIAYLPKVLAAVLIVVVLAATAAFVKDLVQNALSGLSYGRSVANGVSIAILTVGAFMALDQLQIAPRIVSGLFYGLLAVVVGSAIVAIGGSGIKPMQRKWEQALGRAEQETSRIREQRAAAGVEVRSEAQALGLDQTATTEVPQRPLRTS